MPGLPRNSLASSTGTLSSNSVAAGSGAAASASNSGATCATRRFTRVRAPTLAILRLGNRVGLWLKQLLSLSLVRTRPRQEFIVNLLEIVVSLPCKPNHAIARLLTGPAGLAVDDTPTFIFGNRS